MRPSAIALLAAALAASTTAHGALPLLEGADGVPSLAPLLERVTPAVVNVSVTYPAAQMNPLLRDPFFRRFFAIPEEAPRGEESAGSGVIVDAEQGYVITNHHVVDQAADISITLKDRRRLRAELVGSDPDTDIALLRIPAERLTDIAVGDSEALAVGDFVVAIGNPFGLGQTVTSGIVSALDRSGLDIEGYEDFIQTDASINPGNSGGALVNLRGELVGINTAIIGPAGGNVGIGFAVPSNMARAVVDQLVRYGSVQRGRLGIAVQDITPELAEALALDVTRGAIVSQVEAGSPAERAGVRAGDVVVGFDGTRIGSSADLRNQVGLVRAGEAVRLDVLRDGEKLGIAARVAGAGAGVTVGSGPVLPALEGATFRALAPGDPGHGELEGVLIAEVVRGAPAWEHGLRPGDVVVGVNRLQVRSLEELRQALGRGTRAVALDVVRGPARLFVMLQ